VFVKLIHGCHFDPYSMNLPFLFIYKHMFFTDYVVTKKLINLNIKTCNRHNRTPINRLIEKVETILCQYEVD
jgi:hypothetical protein